MYDIIGDSFYTLEIVKLLDVDNLSLDEPEFEIVILNDTEEANVNDVEENEVGIIKD